LYVFWDELLTLILKLRIVMLKNKTLKFSLLFFFILAATIWLDHLDHVLYYFAKPLVAGSLLWFFINTSSEIERRIERLVKWALICSLLGDILLMFVPQSEHFFTLGLVAFLTAHVFYVLAFFQKPNGPHNAFNFAFYAGFFSYAYQVYKGIKPNLGDMKYPVILYITVITIMACTAISRSAKNKVSYFLVVAGALFFVASDSILAIEKFHKPLFCPEISIMLTYGLAQWCITMGILKTKP